MTLLVQAERVHTNWRILQKQAGQALLLPLLEANAYGMGDVEIVRLLAEEGVRTVAVSRLEEAVRLAQAVRGMDILLLTPYAGAEDIALILQHDIIGAVGSNDSAVLFHSLSRQLNCRARVQLCFDFGTGRYGYAPQEAAKATQTIRHLDGVQLCGVFTVLPSGGRNEKKGLQEQSREFPRVLAAIEREGLPTGLTHMANIHQQAAISGASCNTVRVSTDLFGRGPLREKQGLKKVGRTVSTVCDVKWLAAGATVGEDGRCHLRKATRVAVIPAGRADGLFSGNERKRWPFGSRLYCEINGKKAAILGRAGLTSLTADVTNLDCAPGDIVAFEADPVMLSAFARREYV